MEVHPPEHGIHSWRDFLVHMGTITLGLVIALGLEAAAESVHHHLQVAEAREQLRRELEENRQTIVKDREFLQNDSLQMRANLAALEGDGPLDASKLKFGWSWNGPTNSSWQTARETGAVALMPYEEGAAVCASLSATRRRAERRQGLHPCGGEDGAAVVAPR